MSNSKFNAIYVVSTHWDREWYEPFQHYRYHLVEVMDEVLDKMAEDERFACFQTDGQSILLEDYLEIRPERAEQVRAFARDGRLRIGPWYTMPDENIVAPESLIRNLEEGIRVARAFGNVSRAGFVCDIFGHVSQLPQIFNGFGIQSAFLFRGVNEDTHRGLFRWRGADGSELITFRFGPKEGYFDYADRVRCGFKSEEPFALETAVDRLVEYVDIQRERVGLDTVLLFDGGDHMPIEPQTVALLDGLRSKRPDVEVIFAGLDEFAAAAGSQRQSVPRTFQGELREPGRLHGEGAWLIPGVLSSRIKLKQANRACEVGLCLWAEPFSEMSRRLTGQAYPHGFLRRSWRYLLENHAHDSICGCSPDQVHKDMEFRFDQSRLINGKVIDGALNAIARRVDLPNLEGEDFAMVVFNPTQAAINGPVDLELWFNEKTEKTFSEFFRFEDKVGFRLFDSNGTEIPYDRPSYVPRRRRFYRVTKKSPRGEECIVVHVTAPLEIPAFGYTTVICRPVAEVTRHPAGKMVVSERAIENERIRVEVETGGTLAVHDRKTGERYAGLLAFEERADIGDGWYHGIALNDQVFTTACRGADVAVIEDGAHKATLRILHRLEVPERFCFDTKMRRSATTRTILMDTRVTLRAGADHVEIHTHIDNNVRDHRIRVLFDTDVNADTYLADSAFDVVERKIALPADNHAYRELSVETTPHANWVAVHQGGRGLAVVAPDLPEATVRDLPARPIALTLLRGFVRTVFTDGEEGGQSLGPHDFHYRLVPLDGAADPVRLAQIAQRAGAGCRARQVLPRDQAPPGDRTLPTALGQLTLSAQTAIFSSLRRRPETDALELRVFNPTEAAVLEKVSFATPVRSAVCVDLEGRRRKAVETRSDGTIEVELLPKQVVTLAVEFGP